MAKSESRPAATKVKASRAKSTGGGRNTRKEGKVESLSATRSSKGVGQLLRFGSVLVESDRVITAEERRRNIRRGQEALDAAQIALADPGVKLKLAKGTPRYHADPSGRIVQVLGKDVSVGRFVNGKFRPGAT